MPSAYFEIEYGPNLGLVTCREMCKVCNGYLANSLEDILFESKYMETKWANLWRTVELECP